MRHKMAYRKLGRKTAHRHAMFANLLSSLIMNDQIKTTLPKAKELRRLADQMVTLGKKGTLHSRRQAISIVRDKVAVGRLFSETAERYKGRNGGYTRILKLGYRDGDSAPMAIIEYILEGEDVGQLAAPATSTKKSAKKTKEKPAKKAEKKTEKKAKAEKKSPKKEKKADTKKKKAKGDSTSKKTTAKKTATKKKAAKK